MLGEDECSRFDPSRFTVGKIYQDVQLYGDKSNILVGDMANEMVKECLDDVNAALMSDPYHGYPFYVMLHEKKDLQMKSAILRRVIKLPFRPWPEDDTVVFLKNPKTQEVRFCWALPHWSEMDNILMNSCQYASEMVNQILDWKKFNMEAFGFMKLDHERWGPNPNHMDRVLC